MYQELAVPVLQKNRAYSSTSVKEVVHETKPEIPLQGACEDRSLLRLVINAEQTEDRLQGAGQRKSEIEEVLVEQGNEIILLSHDSVGNVMCI